MMTALIGRVVSEIEIVEQMKQIHFAANIEFVVDVIKIRVDGPHRNPHLCGDLVVSLPFANQIGNVLLAR